MSAPDKENDDLFCSVCSKLGGAKKFTIYGFLFCENCTAKVLIVDEINDMIAEGNPRKKSSCTSMDNETRIIFNDIMRQIGVKAIKSILSSEKRLEVKHGEATPNDKELLNGVINQLKTEIVNLNIRIDNLEMELEDLKDTEKEHLAEIDSLKKKSPNKNVKSKLRKKLDSMENKMQMFIKGGEPKPTVSKTQYLSPDDFGVIKKHSVQEYEFDHDYIWMVQDFATKTGKFNSPTFKKGKYSLCLCGYHSGLNRDLFRLSLHIVRGDQDHEADWPMKYTVTINIHNQNTMYVHDKRRFTYMDFVSKEAYERPTTAINKGIGYLVILGRDISYVDGLMKKNEIMVSCLLEPP